MSIDFYFMYHNIIVMQYNNNTKTNTYDCMKITNLCRTYILTILSSLPDYTMTQDNYQQTQISIYT